MKWLLLGAIAAGVRRSAIQQHTTARIAAGWPRLRGWSRLKGVVLPVLLAAGQARAQEVWRLENLNTIGGHAVTVEGAPKRLDSEAVPAIAFDGVRDGVFVPAIPFAGAPQFTIEILFRPLEGGLAEQRFFHAQDAKGARALLETRLNGKGGWWLDTFITSKPTGGGVTLIDPQRVHATGRWYWAALRYDGKTMAHFVNGQKEIERDASFDVFGPGQISLGVRQNKIHWFKGAIREVRFHREALPDQKLQRID